MDTQRIMKLSDQKIINLFDDLVKAFGARKFSAQAYGTAFDISNENERKHVGDNTFVISSARLSTTDSKFSVIYTRGITKAGTAEPSAYFDEVKITPGAGDAGTIKPDIADIIRCEKILKTYASSPVLPDTAGTESVTDLLQAQISSLAAQYQDMIGGIDKRRADLDKAHDEKLLALEVKYKEQEDAFKSEEKKIRDKLTADDEALVQRAKALDDRDHRHVRRDLRTNINDDIKARLGRTLVSKQASVIRWVIFVMAVMGAYFLGEMSLKTFQEFSQSLTAFETNSQAVQKLGPSIATHTTVTTALLWALLVKSLLSSFGALGFIVYAIGWLRRLYHDDVQQERDLERYAYDINRASWAIETIMDIRKDGTLPPQTWIEAVCNNLFIRIGDDQEHKDVSPLETLLSSSAKVEFGPDGARFELDKSGAKKLSKEISN